MAARICFVLLLAGCAGEAPERADVSADLESRTGRGLGPGSPPGETAIPPGVRLEDGLTEDEAAAVALWNNAAFLEALADLGVRRAELVQAGMLPNPVLSVLFPVGPKQLEFAAKLPLDALVLRPKRIAAAEREAERTAALLVQHGLDLARDVRQAHAEAVLAARRAELSNEAAALRSRIAGLFEARLRAGDVSELEAGTVRADAARAQLEAASARHEAQVVLEKLRSLVGLAGDERALTLASGGARRVEFEAGDLAREALAARPDVRAAELAIEAAGERAGLTRIDYLGIAGILDANDPKGKDGVEIGPGLELAVPILNRNEGGRARADAELERAARRYVTVRHAVLGDLAAAVTRYRQADEAEADWRGRVLPALDQALEQARKAHEEGEVPASSPLEAEARRVEARMRAAEAESSLKRARAELERCAGRKLEEKK